MKRLSRGRQGMLAFAVLCFISGLALAPVRADIVVQFDKSSQRMAVSIDGTMQYNWPISTGRSVYGTPSGVFHPQWMARYYFSRKYYSIADAARDFLQLRLCHSWHQ